MNLYIIHGWTYSLDKWSELVELLKNAGFKPIQLKVPGLAGPSNQVWDIDGYVEWLDRELKGEPAPVVIGHSNGGRIALAYAQARPGRLKQLILIDSAGVPHRDAKTTSKRQVFAKLSRVGRIFAHVPLARKILYKLLGAQDYYNAPPNMKKTMQNMLAADDSIQLTKINIPVTLIWGGRDTATPLKDGELMAQGLPKATLTVIEDAAHSPHATHPERVAELITQAVKS